MAGRGPQSFKKRQREQQRKERHHAKIEKRLQRRRAQGENRDQAANGGTGEPPAEEAGGLS